MHYDFTHIFNGNSNTIESIESIKETFLNPTDTDFDPSGFKDFEEFLEDYVLGMGSDNYKATFRKTDNDGLTTYLMEDNFRYNFIAFYGTEYIGAFDYRPELKELFRAYKERNEKNFKIFTQWEYLTIMDGMQALMDNATAAAKLIPDIATLESIETYKENLSKLISKLAQYESKLSEN